MYVVAVYQHLNPSCSNDGYMNREIFPVYQGRYEIKGYLCAECHTEISQVSRETVVREDQPATMEVPD